MRHEVCKARVATTSTAATDHVSNVWEVLSCPDWPDKSSPVTQSQTNYRTLNVMVIFVK